MEVSRSSIDIHLDRSARHKVEGDPITKIYALIRDLANRTALSESGSKELSYDQHYHDYFSHFFLCSIETIRELVKGRNFTEEQLQNCLSEFDQCNIWGLNANGSTLTIYN